MLADLSRTVDDTMLALEYSRLQLDAAPPQRERLRLQRDLAQIIDALLELLGGGQSERTVVLSSAEDVVVPGSIVTALRRDSGSVEATLKERLERLSSELPEADSLDPDQVDLLEAIAEAADVEATVSMRPLMRR